MIDEKKLIEKLNEYKSLLSLNVMKETLDCVIKTIETQPKVGEWIPVEERLPESCENFLVYTKRGHYRIGEYFEEHKRWWLGVYWEDSDFILAWQPLPEPYEVKENE